MRCPFCSEVDDKVVDSRLAEDGGAIRRRRECLTCGRRFTTYERLAETALVVVKRSGTTEAFDLEKVTAGIAFAVTGRGIDDETVVALAGDVEDQMRSMGAEVASEQVGLAVLERLGTLDQVAYLRFASVYKGFEDASDFERELTLLTKTTAPKRRADDA